MLPARWFKAACHSNVCQQLEVPERCPDDLHLRVTRDAGSQQRRMLHNLPALFDYSPEEFSNADKTVVCDSKTFDS